MLARDIRDYLERLVEKHACVSAIWLIGSRANGCSHAQSDWDFLVFGDDSTLQSMRCDPSLKRDNIDLLVVYDGNSFEEPWGENPKGGNLTKWQWSEVSENEAKYMQTKWVKNEENTKRFGVKHNMAFGDMIESQVKGILIWKNPKGFVLQ